MRIVIDKNHRIKSNIQCLLDLADIGSLWRPIRSEHGHIIQSQHHVRMGFKNRTGDRFFIFRADNQQNSAFLELLEPSLDIRKHPTVIQFAKFNVFDSVVTHDSTPQRIVTIQYNTFFHESRLRLQLGVKFSHQQTDKVRSPRQSGAVIDSPVNCVLQAHTCQ